MGTPKVKVVVIGNKDVGKTSLLMTHESGKFPPGYIPDSLGGEVHKYMVDGRSMIVAFWDTGGGLAHLRPLSYPETDVFLLCFDIGNRASFDCIPEEWVPEVRTHCPDVPIMLMGCKKDLRESTPATCVPLEEVEKKVEEWKMAAYFEVSSLFNVGLAPAVKQCMRIGYHHRMTVQSNPPPPNNRTPRPPVMPLEEPLPAIESDPSSFAEDWHGTLKDQRDTDVLFVLRSGTEMRAHRIVLCAASSFFNNVIDPDCRGTLYTDAQPAGISRIDEGVEHDGRLHITFALESEIDDHVFRHCLQFLYTGDPDFCAGEEAVIVEKLISLSQLWQLHLLESVCVNIQNEEPDLNPSIADTHTTEIGERLAKDFLIATKWTDVSFRVEGRDIAAHRLVLCTRCPVFASMLSERFREGITLDRSIPIPNTTYVTFMALLEYLYSDHAPIEEGDPVNILVLANQFCQPRLVTLAEYYITKCIERFFTENAVDAGDVNVVAILYSAIDHNAKQLPNWCLHFIARNYARFKSRPEFSSLKEEDRIFVEEHQWPPLSYQRDLAQYRAAQRKCNVM